MKNKPSMVRVDISHKTILYITLLALIWKFSIQIKDVLLGLFVAIILVGAMNPLVENLEKRGIPRWLSILILYLLLILVLVLVISGIFPPLVNQTTDLLKSLPLISRQVDFMGLDIGETLSARLNEQITQISSGAFRLTVSVLTNIVSVFGVLVISFYLLLEHRNLDGYLFSLFGDEGSRRGKEIVIRLEKRLGGWIRAQLLLMTIVGLLSYIGYRILGLTFALPLAILAGLLEIVPNVGPVLAAIPAILLGLSISPFTALLVAAWNIIVQQLENNLIVPRLMKTVTGINPVVTLLSLAVGLKLAGTVGMILAIPSYLTLEILFKEFFPALRKNI
jgi:predicted PurR-regulated permease PerM